MLPYLINAAAGAVAAAITAAAIAVWFLLSHGQCLKMCSHPCVIMWSLLLLAALVSPSSHTSDIIVQTVLIQLPGHAVIVAG